MRAAITALRMTPAIKQQTAIRCRAKCKRYIARKKRLTSSHVRSPAFTRIEDGTFSTEIFYAISASSTVQNHMAEGRLALHSFVSASSRFMIKLVVAVHAATSTAFRAESAIASPV